MLCNSALQFYYVMLSAVANRAARKKEGHYTVFASNIPVRSFMVGNNLRLHSRE